MRGPLYSYPHMANLGSLSSSEMQATQSNSPDSDRYKSLMPQKQLLQKKQRRLMPKHAMRALSMKLSELAMEDYETLNCSGYAQDR